MKASAILLVAMLAAGGPRVSGGPLEAAKAAEAAGDYAAAEAAYEAAVEADPNNAEILQRLGLARHLQGRFESAAAAFGKAIELEPELWGSRLFLGIDLYRLNAFDEARRHLEVADRLRLNDPEILFWLGATRLALGQDFAGLKTLERSVELDPARAEAWKLLARRYSELSIALRAEIVNEQADSPWGLLVKAQTLEAEGRPEAAVEAYEAALKAEPDLPDARAGVGRVLWSRGERTRAVDYFRRELTRRPEHPDALYYLGAAALEAGRVVEAVERLAAAVKQAPESAEAHVALAHALAAAGRGEEAADAARTAAALAPRSEAAHEVFTAVLSMLGDRQAIAEENRRWKSVRSSPLSVAGRP